MKNLRIAALAALAWLGLAVPVLAQSSPGLHTGQVPTAAQWNSYFAAKQDYLGFAPLNPSSVIATSPVTVVYASGVLTVACPTCITAATGGVTGPGASVDGDIAIWNGTIGGAVRDAGGGIPNRPVNSPSSANGQLWGSGCGTNKHEAVWADNNVCFNNDVIKQTSTDPSSGLVVTVGGTVPAGNWDLVFTFGSGVCVAGAVPACRARFTTAGGESLQTVANGIACAIANNSNLFDINGGTCTSGVVAPVAGQSYGGYLTSKQVGYVSANALPGIEIDWNGNTALKVVATPPGSGTLALNPSNCSTSCSIQLDGGPGMVMARSPGFAPPANSSIYNLYVTGPTTAIPSQPTVNYGAMSHFVISSTAGALSSRWVFQTTNLSGSTWLSTWSIGGGLYAESAADIGPGTINLPSTGSYLMNAALLANNAGTYAIANNLFGGSSVGSPLNLQSTSNVSPSGDFVQIKAGGVVGYKFDGTTSTFGVAGSLLGQIALAGNTSGTTVLRPDAAASGTATLKAGTYDVLGTTLAQTISNKTIGDSNAINVTDAQFTLEDNVTPTKQFQFQLSSLAVGANVWTIPVGAAETFVGLAVTQTLTNKTLTNPLINILGSPGSMTISDAGLFIVANADNTKKWVFDVSGIATGTTRTWIVPNANDTFVGLTATQTLTNKTLTAPVLGVATGTSFNGATFAAPQVTTILTAVTNQTYSTPAGATRLEIEGVGAGGGGAGSGTSPGAATSGGNTCIAASGTACSSPLLSGTGGALGKTDGNACVGGTYSGSLTADNSQAGGTGGLATGSTGQPGGNGGGSRYSGSGIGGTINGVGQPAAANSGSGGGGAGNNVTANTGGGGCAGGWFYKIISSPAASYVYTTGAAGVAGTAGTGGTAGGAGALPSLTFRAYFNFLFRRDIDPASNDNTPAFLAAVA